MKEQARAIASQEQEVGAIVQSVFASKTLGGTVLAGAIYDPKLPPLVSD